MARPVLGVTGRLAAGKDTVCRILRSLGYAEIDVDRIGHQVLAEETAAIRAAFGTAILDPAGAPDRRALGRLVFADPAALLRLETILHPPMCGQVRRYLERITGPAVINAALLFRMGLDRLCDRVLIISAPDPLLLARAIARGLSEETARARLASQKDINPRPASADALMENTGSPAALEDAVRRFSQIFLSGASDGNAAATTESQPEEGTLYPEPG